jgi:hypothetical protein
VAKIMTTLPKNEFKMKMQTPALCVLVMPMGIMASYASEDASQ